MECGARGVAPSFPAPFDTNGPYSTPGGLGWAEGTTRALRYVVPPQPLGCRRQASVSVRWSVAFEAFETKE